MAYTTIPKSTAQFDTKLITGNGGTQNITGLNFQPDFTWIKGRDVAENHALFDAPRGVTKRLMSDTTGAETTVQGVTAFNSDGFTLGALSAVNQNNGLFASWNWKANGQGSANTDGTINTTYTSANTTSGCSIVTYTGNGTSGATIGHGLGVAPAVVLVKRLNATSDWVMYHKGMGASKFIVLNTNSTEASSAGIFYNTAPTSSIFYVGSDGATNASGGTYVAYCFADVQGFSKMGSYTGNGNADGAFIYTGFKPAFILLKNTGTARHWQIYDSKRIGYNVANYRQPANTYGTEETNVNIDILSNGFKARSTDGDVNENGKTYIYMSFAGEPLVSTNGTPATAR